MNRDKLRNIEKNQENWYLFFPPNYILFIERRVASVVSIIILVEPIASHFPSEKEMTPKMLKCSISISF